MKLPALAYAVALMVLAPRAIAADWYVDAVNGSNSASGASPVDAWRTITHALEQIGSAPDTIHVLPGTYDTVLGETFPLNVQDGLVVVGDAGPEETRIAGSPGLPVFLLDASHQSIIAEFHGITVRDAAYGIRCIKGNDFTNGCIALTIRDAVFENCGRGVDYECFTFAFICNSIQIEDVDFVGGQWGVCVDHAEFDDLNMWLTRCTFQGQSQAVYQSAGIETLDFLTVEQCRFEGPGSAISTGASSSGQMTTRVHDTVIANSTAGVNAQYYYGSTITRSTLTGIANTAVDGGGTIQGCVFFDNGTDLGTGGGFSVVNTNLSRPGPPVGQNGNISVDPLFRDPAHGDYRLGWGTGCVDAIPGLVSPDLAGFARGNDGDLDLVGAGDMGALELRTLEVPETIPIGEKLHVDYHAEVGAFGALYLARTTQLPSPLATPFGDQWLPPGFLELVGMQKVLTPDPVRRTIYIPNSPALVGQQFSFQALSRSSAAPMGAAWTDAATVTFTL